MRNVFDQYSGNENRLSHALATALDCDRDFRAAFLKTLARSRTPPPADIKVACQTYPGQAEMSEADAERRGIPDLWLYSEATRWCVVVECKITARLTAGQVARHRATAIRRGFEHVESVTITAIAAGALPDTVPVQWREVYTLMRSRDWPTAWPRLAADYFERLEASMAGQLTEGTLTCFDGIRFRAPEDYSYPEAARVLRLALDELRRDAVLIDTLGVDPDLPGRGAIKGRGGTAVWDFLRLRASAGRNFTDLPHLTLGIKHDYAEAVITIPDKLDRTMRRALLSSGAAGFEALAAEIVANLAPVLARSPNAAPLVRAIQRRYPSMSAPPFIDALVEADLRTARTGHGVKPQPQWLLATHDAFARKLSNLQLQFGVRFDYRRCPEIATPAALDLFSASWQACAPVLRALGLPVESRMAAP